jgi:branched-subunit amino acid transport protein AzlD
MTNEQFIHSVLIILVCAAVTYLLRGIAFLIFGGKRGTPAFISWLGKVLPHAVMGMLLVYCLKDVQITSAPFGLPELAACAIVVLLHVWKRNSLLSIGVGTVSYMVMVALI